MSFNLHEWHIHARGQLRNWDLKKALKGGKERWRGVEEKLHKKGVLAYKGGLGKNLQRGTWPKRGQPNFKGGWAQ